MEKSNFEAFVVPKPLLAEKARVISVTYCGPILRKSALLHHKRLRITIYPAFSVSCVIEL
jgi:hypothetical protein